MAFYGDLALGENTTLAIHEQAIHFYQGVVTSNEDTSTVSFLNNAQAFNAHPQSYVQTPVAIDAQATFRFHMSQLEIDYIDRMLLKAFSKGIKQTEVKDYLASYGKSFSLSGLEKRIKRLKLRFEANTVTELVTIALRKGLI